MVESSGDRDFSVWLNFFEQDKPSLTKFFNIVNKKDTYFLNHPLDVDFDNELYEKIRPGGFIEKDFQEILANENPKETYYKTRLILCMTKGINLSLIKDRIGEKNFYSVIEMSLIDGHYEEYGVEFEKIISLIMARYQFPRTSLIDVAILRGVNLGSRYSSEKEEKSLKKIQLKNKIKISFGV